MGEDVVEGLDHRTPDLLCDPLAIEHAPVDRINAAIAKLGMVVADIDYDDAARCVCKQRPRKIGDGLCWNGEDDDFSGLRGGNNRNGRRADLGRQRGQALRSSRVRNRDVMTALGEVARKYPSHASSADDSNSHVDALSPDGGYFSNFGNAGFSRSHGCASDVHTSTCGLNQLGSSRLAVLIAAN